MADLKRKSSSRKKKDADQQGRFKQGTLFDHFIKTQASSSSSTPPTHETGRTADTINAHPVDDTAGTPAISVESIVSLDPSPLGQTGSTSHAGSFYRPSLQEIAEVDPELNGVSRSAPVAPTPSPLDVRSIPGSPLSELTTLTDLDATELDRSSPISISGSSHGRSTLSSPCSSGVIDLTLDEGTAKAPISIESSPVSELASLKLTPPASIPFHPLPLRKRKPQKSNSPPDAPLPDASTQHVRGSTSFTWANPIRASSLGRRTPPVTTGRDAPQYNSLKSALGMDDDSAKYNPRRSADANTLLGSQGDLHPAVSSILGLGDNVEGTKEVAQQYWNDRWRPRRAEHILGNEKGACFLREWMHALRLHFDKVPSSREIGSQPKRAQRKRKRGAQRPQVVREVQRKRRKTGVLDSWIVNDDDTDDEPNTLVDLNDRSSPDSWDSALPQSQPIAFGRRIRNTVLLAGPPGCGKTAAVYACAEELGWNVFEVYPGLGKRGGTRLDDLIGDVGRNHTLPQPLFFQRGRSEPPSPVKVRPAKADDVLDGPPDTATQGPDAVTHSTAPSQSVVLIEEADVVFADEAGFWPSVVAFIKQCRRPVIITCNDISLIPVENLPLEATLTFESTPTSLVSSLLGAICEAEGRQTAEQETSEDVLSLGYIASTVDLRQRINQCQFGLPDPGGQASEEAAYAEADAVFSLRVNLEAQAITASQSDERGDLRALRQSFKSADTASYLDACVIFPQPHNLEVAEDHPDDEVGHDAFRIVQRLGMPVLPEYYSRDVNVAAAASRTFEGVLERCLTSVSLADAHAREEVPWPSCEEYRRRLRDGLGSVPSLASMVNHRGLYLDYRPLIGLMVTTDDQMEAERMSLSQESRSRRQTRNSQKSSWEGERWLQVTEEFRAAVKTGGLPGVLVQSAS
ncbi:hypothetical protein BC834DRAFT_864959 [Gloeopeniophorella convolvens]|nr:hypothetical protein BC834DRAFT_864959 [Gloeopeniophorella convolvens]